MAKKLTNAERFTTARARYRAFSKFCSEHTCSACPAFRSGSVSNINCAFRWLELETSDTGLKPCYRCGDKPCVHESGGLYWVGCSCGLMARQCKSKKEAKAAWNCER